MTPEQEKQLREPFPPEEIGKLPRVSCGDCRNAQGKVCQKHTKSKCDICGNWITNAHLHLDYVGHAEITDRFLLVDPSWTWEPVAWTEDGQPQTMRHGPNLVMWGRLTLCGVARLGVGTAPAGKDDAHKELIGDFLRNAGMRFGVALDLWRKSERLSAEEEHAEPEQPSEPLADHGTHEAIRSMVANLPDDLRDQFVAWYQDQGYPPIKSADRLSQSQAEAVCDHIDQLDPPPTTAPLVVPASNPPSAAARAALEGAGAPT